jgi:colanic acid/amylovoran biosynthesis glycosyltransferase
MQDGRVHLLEVGLRWPPEAFLRRKLEGVAGRGAFRVTVASAGARAGETEIPGVELTPLPAISEPRLRSVLQIAMDGLALLVADPGRLGAVLHRTRDRRLLRPYLALARLRPDLVHFEWESVALRFRPLAEVWRCPYVVSCRGSGVNVHPHTATNPLGRGLAATFRRAAAVHCVSEAIIEEATRYGLERGKARLIRPATDTEFFQPPERARPSHDGLRVVAVGSLYWQKGYEYALQAIGALHDRGIAARLEIVGADPPSQMGFKSDRERIRNIIDDLGLADAVCLHGGVAPDELRGHLHRADVLLHASLSEGLPNVVLEAMACGLPVVVTDCGGIREAVTDGVEGFVVPVRRPDEMADALATLWQDPDLRGEMGRAGRARVCAEFTLTRQVESFVRLYDDVAGRASH